LQTQGSLPGARISAQQVDASSRDTSSDDFSTWVDFAAEAGINNSSFYSIDDLQAGVIQ
jgi:hypothetical protein